MPTENHVYTTETGEQYRMGLLPPKHPGVLQSVQDGLPSMPIYSRADLIKKLSAAGGSICLPYRGPIYSQNGYNWCWDFASCQMIHLLNDLLYGDNRTIDPSLPAKICVDFSNSGDAIDSVLVQVLKPYGILTADYVGSDPVKPRIVRQLPDGWQAEAAKRGGIESFTASDFLDLASGVVNGHPGVLGVNCGAGGHAIGCCEIGLEGDGQEQSATLYMATPGTWGANYTSGWAAYPGKPGWYRLSERQTGAAWNGGYGAYVFAGIKDDGAVPDLN